VFTKYDRNGTSYTVYGSSKGACPKIDASAIWDFIQANSKVFLVIFGVMGLFLCFFG